jgi:hypothetical protein
VKVLPTVGDPTVRELEDDAVADLQVLAVSVSAAGLNSARKVPPVSCPSRPKKARVSSRLLQSPEKEPRPGVCHEALSSKVSVSVSMSAVLKAS